MGLIIFIAVVIIGGVIVTLKMQAKMKKGMETKLQEMGLTLSQKYFSDNGMTGIAVDEVAKKVCFFSGGPKSQPKVVNFSDVIESEVIVDGQSATKTNRGSQVGHAIIGGILLGPLGAVVGGLTGSKRQIEKVKKIELQVTINDLSKPINKIIFLNSETSKNGIVFKAVVEQANHWHGVMSTIIKQSSMNTIAAEGSAITQ